MASQTSASLAAKKCALRCRLRVVCSLELLVCFTATIARRTMAAALRSRFASQHSAAELAARAQRSFRFFASTDNSIDLFSQRLHWRCHQWLLRHVHGCLLFCTECSLCFNSNECLTNHGGCDPVVPCINTNGSRTCGNCPTCVFRLQLFLIALVCSAVAVAIREPGRRSALRSTRA